MNHLDEISVEELQSALNNVKEKKPTQRLLAAIAYKKDVTQTELAEWHGVQRRTIYNWLQRLDADEPLEQAVSDVQRPGRTRKLSEAQEKALENILQDPPEKVGIDAPTWTPAIAQDYLKKTYDVEYSLPSCRRLLKEAGLRYQNSPPPALDAERSDSHDEPEKNHGKWTPS